MRARQRNSDEFINFLDSVGVVTNKSEAISYLASKSGVKVETIKREISKINRNAETTTKRYYTIDGEECQEDAAYAHYMVIHTGRVHKDSGEALYFVFFKRGSEWNGCFINTMAEFLGNANEYLEKVTGEKAKEDAKSVPNITVGDKVSSPFLESISGETDTDDTDKVASGSFVVEEIPAEVLKRLEPVAKYISEVCNAQHWVFDNEQQLLNYLFAVNNKVLRLVKKVKSSGVSNEFIIFSTDKVNVLFNTGVRTRLGKNIYVIGKLVGEDPRFYSFEVLRCRDCLGARNFDLSVADCLPKPVEMYKSDSDLIFHGDLFDVDVENTTYLSHILVDRVNRLPQYMQEMEYKERQEEFIRRVRLAFDRQIVDKTYFKPFFSHKDDSVGFLIPFYEGDVTVSNLEFAAVLVKSQCGFWITPTILTSQLAARSVRQFLPFARI